MSRQPGRTPAVLGLDLGTTEVKAGLVDLDGHLLALARGGYGLDVSGGHDWAAWRSLWADFLQHRGHALQ